MKKEVIVAIIVGFSLGLVITYGVYRAQSSLSQKAAKDEASNQPANQDLPVSPILLSITQPMEGSISDQDTVSVGGITQKNTLVTVISPSDHQAVQADELGNFSLDIALESGPNRLTVTSFNEDGSKQEKVINVIYSTYDFESESKE
ncbi:hypothetical protein A3B57_01990 [Microgenomates group bacterium RIFCSPLOWO2_01_FULL_47_10]|nr:MAG: hypothetical protein A3B57_01990 [Microgenomates group bacterium RIFCSPLOWO2_01_FULL_47_10]